MLRFYHKHSYFVTTITKRRNRIVLAVVHSVATALSYLGAEFALEQASLPTTPRNTIIGLVAIIAVSGIGVYLGGTVAICLLKKGEVKESQNG